MWWSLVRSPVVAAGFFLATVAVAQAPQRLAVPAVLWGLNDRQELVRFQADRPETMDRRVTLTGLGAGERLVGIDFRVARGVLYGVSSAGRVYTIDTASGVASAVGAAPAPDVMGEGPHGVDFNPAADRIRVVGANGLNLRLHPDTGALIDYDAQAEGVQRDPDLTFAEGDIHAGRRPDVVAAAYTYNNKDDKLTTNFVIDRSLGALVMQGSKEGQQPVVSPNLGRLTTVGSLGLGPLLDVSFDISDVRNEPLAVIRTPADPRSRLVAIDLDTGLARVLGVVGQGEPLRGMAIEP